MTFNKRAATLNDLVCLVTQQSRDLNDPRVVQGLGYQKRGDIEKKHYNDKGMKRGIACATIVQQHATRPKHTSAESKS